MSNTLKLGNGQWATGKDTLLSFSDTNNNYKPLPFSFSRDTSATVVNKDGLIETVGSGEPRIDFKDNTKGALKLEPQRTNEWFYSEDFSNSNWIKTNVTISENSIISPDGTLSASKIIDNSTSGEHRVRGNAVYIPSGANFSIFVKAGEYNKFAIANLSDLYLIKFDLSNGTIISTGNGWSDAKIENYGNGWYRLSGNVSINKTCGYGLLNDDGDFVFSGTGNKGVYIWGAQFEPNSSYPTSYIPTSGSAVTRVAESSSQTVPDGVIGQTEGTIYAKFNYSLNLVGGMEISPLYIGNGTYQNAIYIDIYQNNIYAVVFNGGSNQVSLNCGSLSQGVHKVAISYSVNNTVIFVDGVKKGEDNTPSIIPQVNKVFLGTVGSSTQIQSYKVYEAKIYNTALTDQELIALTQV